MPRSLVVLALGLAACTPPEPAAEEPAPPVKEAAPSAPAPATPAAPAAPSPEAAAASAPEERPLPPALAAPTTITVVRYDGRPSVKVSSDGGKVVEWKREEVRLEPVKFEPSAVTARTQLVDVWDADESAPRTLRVCMWVRGLPKDSLFLELDPASSEIAWSGGSKGTFRAIHAQRPQEHGSPEGEWCLDVLATLPEGVEPAVDRLRVALDLHRATRVRRSEVSLGVGDAATYGFGTEAFRWILAEDLELREFRFRRFDEPLLPLMKRGLRAERLVRLVDADGRPLREGGGGGTSMTSIYDWWGPTDHAVKPPARVTVDLPDETVKTRVEVRLENVRPTR